MPWLIPEASAGVSQVTRLSHPLRRAGFMVIDKNDFFLVPYIQLCLLSFQKPKEEQTGPRTPSPLQYVFINCLSGTSPNCLPVYRHKCKDYLPEPWAPYGLQACRIQKRQGIELPSVRNSGELQTRSTSWGPLLFLSLSCFGKAGKLNPRWADNWKQRLKGLKGPSRKMPSKFCIHYVSKSERPSSGHKRKVSPHPNSQEGQYQRMC